MVIAAGLPPILFAGYQWIVYSSLPHKPLCGNCWLGSVGIPLELALLAGVLVWRALQRQDLLQQDGAWWSLVGCGILATPFLIGVPVYLAGLLMLVWPH